MYQVLQAAEDEDASAEDAQRSTAPPLDRETTRHSEGCWELLGPAQIWSL